MLNENILNIAIIGCAVVIVILLVILLIVFLSSKTKKAKNTQGEITNLLSFKKRHAYA